MVFAGMRGEVRIYRLYEASTFGEARASAFWKNQWLDETKLVKRY